MRILGTAVLCAVLAGCAGSPFRSERDARANYEKSVANYRTCLIENPSDVKACEGFRLAQETDERAFNNMSASLQNRSSTANINVQQR
jgi:hypothetical protein